MLTAGHIRGVLSLLVFRIRATTRAEQTPLFIYWRHCHTVSISHLYKRFILSCLLASMQSLAQVTIRRRVSGTGSHREYEIQILW
jgi:hypothetical protein